jgi:hypothetical protein
VRRLESSRLAWIALALLLAVTAVFLLRETRGNTFWVDEWDWALRRRGDDIGTFLRPHNEHLSLVPLVLYRILFATAGMPDYAPYRVMGIGAHLLVVLLLFVYARRRIGGLPALLAASVMLLLGPAWQDIIWPFQVGTLISLAAGIGALLALDREDRLGDLLACALLTLTLASSGIGLPVVIGVAVELAWRRRLRAAWIVAFPVALYALWWLGYQQSALDRHNIVLTPGYAVDSAASALSALTGLAGPVNGDGSVTLGWGRPLLVVAAAAVIWRLGRIAPVPARVWALLAMAVSFWLLTGLRRAQISTPYESRYLYVSGLFLLLVAVELARGVPWTRRALAVATAVTVAIVVANFGDLRDGARYLHAQAPQERAVLGALELTRQTVDPDATLGRFPGYPFVVIPAGLYFAAADELGSPAMSAAEIAAAPEDSRRLADVQLHDLLGVETVPGAVPPGDEGPPAIDAETAGSTVRRGSCLRFEPDASRPPGVTPALDVTVPESGLLIRALGGPVTVSARRFAIAFAVPLGTVTGAATLRIDRDLSRAPWHVRTAPAAAVDVCGL